MPDVAKSWTATVGAISFSFANLESVLKIAVLLTALGYNIYLWHRAKKKANKEDSQP